MISQYYFQSCHAVDLFLFLKASQHYLAHAPEVCSWDCIVKPPKLQETGICAVYSSGTEADSKHWVVSLWVFIFGGVLCFFLNKC